METPTLEQFLAACRKMSTYDGMSDEDVKKMYELLTGPSEAFVEALKDWADNLPHAVHTDNSNTNAKNK